MLSVSDGDRVSSVELVTPVVSESAVVSVLFVELSDPSGLIVPAIAKSIVSPLSIYRGFAESP